MEAPLTRRRFDEKARIVLKILVDTGTTHEAPTDLINQAIRRGLGLTRSDLVGDFMRTLHACGYIERGEHEGIWRIHPERADIPIKKEEPGATDG